MDALSSSSASHPRGRLLGETADNRRSVESSLCGGVLHSSPLAATLFNASIHPALFDSSTSGGLWGVRPLMGRPRAGAIRVDCSASELSAFKAQYDGLHLKNVVATIRPHRPRSYDGVEFTPRVAVLVLLDYPNLFHQMGSLIVTAAALREFDQRRFVKNLTC